LRVLVTGSSGFLGPHAARAPAGAGHDVISSSRAAAGPNGAACHLAHDFAAPDHFPDVGSIDAIVHLAGDGNVQRPHADPGTGAPVSPP